jgi:16S rRNA processing protein RimM
MGERLILVAQAAGAFGVKGELRLTAYTDDPLNLLTYSPLLNADGSLALTLTGGRAVQGALIARALEVKTREEAQALRGLRLYVARTSLPEPDEDEFYLADLAGLEARSPDGAVLGAVKSVQNFGAGDLLEIAPADGAPSWWAPFTRTVAIDVRLNEGWLTIVRPPETDI